MQVLSPQIAALFPADCALLRAERCQRTQRPQIMTKQSRTRSRVQQQQDWKNHLISWRFSSAWLLQADLHFVLALTADADCGAAMAARGATWMCDTPQARHSKM